MWRATRAPLSRGARLSDCGLVEPDSPAAGSEVRTDNRPHLDDRVAVVRLVLWPGYASADVEAIDLRPQSRSSEDFGDAFVIVPVSLEAHRMRMQAKSQLFIAATTKAMTPWSWPPL